MRSIFIRSSHCKWTRMYEYSTTDLDHLPVMTLHEAVECCNRVAPFYILRSDSSHVGADMGIWVETFLMHLHHYLYRKWFRPYRSEIEYGQFLARIIPTKPTRLPEKTCSQPIVDLVRALSFSVCTRADKAQDAAKALKDLDPEEQYNKLYQPPDREGQTSAQIIHHQQFFIRQPLFGAVAIAIRAKHYTQEVSDIGVIPVLIVRTGVEDGLSAPIRLDSISENLRICVLSGSDGEISAVETSLETAVSFLMDLEQREIAAFGLRPDPVESTRNLENGYVDTREGLMEVAEELGWTEDMQPLEGPSSTWVDTEIYPTWSGLGAEAEAFVEYQMNASFRRTSQAIERWRRAPE